MSSGGDLLSEGFVHLNGVLTYETGLDVVMSLQTIATTEPWRIDFENIVLFVNSPGGAMHPCMQLIDTMNSIPQPIMTYGTGQCASAGTMVLMNGTKGKRVATRNTVIMSHQLATGNDGKYHEMVASEKELRILHEMMVEHYRRCTGKSRAYIEKNLLPAHDVFMTAEEAKHHGLIDHVIDTNR